MLKYIKQIGTVTMQIDIATMANTMKIPQRIKNKTTV